MTRTAQDKTRHPAQRARPTPTSPLNMMHTMHMIHHALYTSTRSHQGRVLPRAGRRGSSRILLPAVMHVSLRSICIGINNQQAPPCAVTQFDSILFPLFCPCMDIRVSYPCEFHINPTTCCLFPGLFGKLTHSPLTHSLNSLNSFGVARRMTEAARG